MKTAVPVVVLMTTVCCVMTDTIKTNRNQTENELERTESVRTKGSVEYNQSVINNIDEEQNVTLHDKTETKHSLAQEIAKRNLYILVKIRLLGHLLQKLPVEKRQSIFIDALKNVGTDDHVKGNKKGIAQAFSMHHRKLDNSNEGGSGSQESIELDSSNSQEKVSISNENKENFDEQTKMQLQVINDQVSTDVKTLLNTVFPGVESDPSHPTWTSSAGSTAPPVSPYSPHHLQQSPVSGFVSTEFNSQHFKPVEHNTFNVIRKQSPQPVHASSTLISSNPYSETESYQQIKMNEQPVQSTSKLPTPIPSTTPFVVYHDSSFPVEPFQEKLNLEPLIYTESRELQSPVTFVGEEKGKITKHEGNNHGAKTESNNNDHVLQSTKIHFVEKDSSKSSEETSDDNSNFDALNVKNLNIYPSNDVQDYYENQLLNSDHANVEDAVQMIYNLFSDTDYDDYMDYENEKLNFDVVLRPTTTQSPIFTMHRHSEENLSTTHLPYPVHNKAETFAPSDNVDSKSSESFEFSSIHGDSSKTMHENKSDKINSINLDSQEMKNIREEYKDARYDTTNSYTAVSYTSKHTVTSPSQKSSSSKEETKSTEASSRSLKSILKKEPFHSNNDLGRDSDKSSSNEDDTPHNKPKHLFPLVKSGGYTILSNHNSFDEQTFETKFNSKQYSDSKPEDFGDSEEDLTLYNLLANPDSYHLKYDAKKPYTSSQSKEHNFGFDSEEEYGRNERDGSNENSDEKLLSINRLQHSNSFSQDRNHFTLDSISMLHKMRGSAGYSIGKADKSKQDSGSAEVPNMPEHAFKEKKREPSQSLSPTHHLNPYDSSSEEGSIPDEIVERNQNLVSCDGNQCNPNVHNRESLISKEKDSASKENSQSSDSGEPSLTHNNENTSFIQPHNRSDSSTEQDNYFHAGSQTNARGPGSEGSSSDSTEKNDNRILSKGLSSESNIDTSSSHSKDHSENKGPSVEPGSFSKRKDDDNSSSRGIDNYISSDEDSVSCEGNNCDSKAYSGMSSESEIDSSLEIDNISMEKDFSVSSSCEGGQCQNNDYKSQSSSIEQIFINIIENSQNNEDNSSEDISSQNKENLSQSKTSHSEQGKASLLDSNEALSEKKYSSSVESKDSEENEYEEDFSNSFELQDSYDSGRVSYENTLDEKVNSNENSKQKSEEKSSADEESENQYVIEKVSKNEWIAQGSEQTNSKSVDEERSFDPSEEKSEENENQFVIEKVSKNESSEQGKEQDNSKSVDGVSFESSEETENQYVIEKVSKKESNEQGSEQDNSKSVDDVSFESSEETENQYVIEKVSKNESSVQGSEQDNSRSVDDVSFESSEETENQYVLENVSKKELSEQRSEQDNSKSVDDVSNFDPSEEKSEETVHQFVIEKVSKNESSEQGSEQDNSKSVDDGSFESSEETENQYVIEKVSKNESSEQGSEQDNSKSVDDVSFESSEERSEETENQYVIEKVSKKESNEQGIEQDNSKSVDDVSFESSEETENQYVIEKVSKNESSEQGSKQDNSKFVDDVSFENSEERSEETENQYVIEKVSKKELSEQESEQDNSKSVDDVSSFDPSEKSEETENQLVIEKVSKNEWSEQRTDEDNSKPVDDVSFDTFEEISEEKKEKQEQNSYSKERSESQEKNINSKEKNEKQEEKPNYVQKYESQENKPNSKVENQNYEPNEDVDDASQETSKKENVTNQSHENDKPKEEYHIEEGNEENRYDDPNDNETSVEKKNDSNENVVDDVEDTFSTEEENTEENSKQDEENNKSYEKSLAQKQVRVYTHKVFLWLGVWKKT
ncbi:uncharacterized protein LOC111129554 [Crassostrea virginica]